jgi:hypothetical protein
MASRLVAVRITLGSYGYSQKDGEQGHPGRPFEQMTLLSHRANITWSVGSVSTRGSGDGAENSQRACPRYLRYSAPPRLMLGLVFNLFLRESLALPPTGTATSIRKAERIRI